MSEETSNLASAVLWLPFVALAYLLGDAMLEKYGVGMASIEGKQRRRAAQFPSKYKLERTVSPECVAEYFGAIRGALRERAGV